MKDLIHEPLFNKMTQVVMDRCKASGNSVSITVCSKDGSETFVSVDSSGDDMAFMAAESIFLFCKKISNQSNVPVGDLVRLTHQEVSIYLAAMLQKDHEQMELLNNPVGMA